MQWQSRQHTRAARCARGPFPSSVDRPETQTRRKSSRSGGWKRKIESPTAGHSLSRKINIYRAKVAAKNIAVINVVRGLWVQPLSSLPGPSLCLTFSAISSEPRRFASPGQSHSHTLCCDESRAGARCPSGSYVGYPQVSASTPSKSQPASTTIASSPVPTKASYADGHALPLASPR